MQRDYLTILHGLNVGEIKLSREERAVRRNMEDFIEQADHDFQAVIAADLEELKERMSEGDEESATVAKDDAIKDEIVFDDDYVSENENESGNDEDQEDEEMAEASEGDEDKESGSEGASEKMNE